jgi:hypothetical protein
MTYGIAGVVFVGGVLLFALNAFSVLSLSQEGVGGNAADKSWAASRGLYLAAWIYTRIFFGTISLIYSNELTSSGLGSAICLGIAIHLGITGWALVRTPAKSRAAPNILITLTLLSAMCYLAGGLSWYVI